jgi:HAD superfamily phosphatase (TIGR01668 family)
MTFVPEYRFNTFSEMTVDFLLGLNIRGVILDIDNTLEPYENPDPTEKVREWLFGLKEAGISVAFVSNNGKERVERFNKDFGFPAYYKAKKPFKKNLLRAMADMGTTRENTILMGDQVFTDVLAAHNAKIPAVLLPPIRDKRDIFTRFKRLLEKPILRKYEKRKNK